MSKWCAFCGAEDTGCTKYKITEGIEKKVYHLDICPTCRPKEVAYDTKYGGNPQ